jgi:hypothetical protein
MLKALADGETNPAALGRFGRSEITRYTGTIV